MEKPEITAYLKTYCGWSAGVRAVLNKYNLPYTEKDIIANPGVSLGNGNEKRTATFTLC
jgi:Glutaredoxin.